MNNNGKIKELFIFIGQLVTAVVISLVIAKLISMFLVSMLIVQGDSMNPTLDDGQRMVCSIISYKLDEPKRYDIIAFKCDNLDSKVLIKRVIALPGETVRIDTDGNIYINGNIIDDIEGLDVIINAGLAENELTVPENEYFVMGDNRNNSLDSRYEIVGNAKKDRIIGKCIDLFSD